MFIVSFEGLDGSGKSYLAKKIKRSLESRGYSVTYLHEESGWHVRLSPFISTHDSWTRDLLYAASTISVVRQLQQTKPDIVLIDRYIDSLLVYSSDDERRLTKVVRNFLEELSKTVLQPNVTLFLDVPFEIVEKRLSARGEIMNREFEQRIYERFQERIQADPARFYVVTSETSVDEIVEYILEEIEESFPLESSFEDL